MVIGQLSTRACKLLPSCRDERCVDVRRNLDGLYPLPRTLNTRDRIVSVGSVLVPKDYVAAYAALLEVFIACWC